MDTNNKSTKKSFEQLKKEFDTMSKLFDNLNSKNKIKPETSKPNTTSDSESNKMDEKVTDIFFKTNKLPDLTSEEKLLVKNEDIVTQAEDTNLNLEKNTVENESESSIIIEFDNDELKIRNKKEITTDKSNSQTETSNKPKELVNPIKKIEQTNENVQSIESANKKTKAITNNEVPKEIVIPKKETIKEVKSVDNEIKPITNDKIQKEIESPKETEVKPLKAQTQVSYLSIKEKLEKIKKDIKERELLRNQNTATGNTIKKITEKQQLTAALIDVKPSNKSNTQVPISKKVETPIKNTIEQKKEIVTEIKEQKKIPKSTIQSKPIQKKEPIDVKESNVKLQNTQEINTVLKTNKTAKKEEQNSSGGLSIIILILIIIALLVFWFLYIK